MKQWIHDAKKIMKDQKTLIKELEEKLIITGGDEVNQKKDMVEHVIEVTKTILFRETKFIEDKADLEEATKEIIPLLTIEQELDNKTFVKTYQNVVNKAICGQRTYIQGECKKRAAGTKVYGVRFCFILCNHSHVFVLQRQ